MRGGENGPQQDVFGVISLAMFSAIARIENIPNLQASYLQSRRAIPGLKA